MPRFARPFAAACLFLAAACAGAADKPVRLFILSGQSNMAGLKPEVSFTPAVTQAFPDEEVIVVKDAQGGQPIRRWHKAWQPPANVTVPGGPRGDLYDRLLTAVRKAVGEKQPKTVVFVWMQGERDAREKLSAVYAASLKGLVQQLRDELKRPDLGFVIGRLSDHAKDEHWNAVRDAQVAVAKEDRRGAWVDTDDLNGDQNGLHYNPKGYEELGRRFADKAIELAKQPAP